MRVLELTQSGVTLVDGLAGQIELRLGIPAGGLKVASGMAIIGHPQPLLGGHAQHKVPQFLARALHGRGWVVARPNFRGVGLSAGTHDGGSGETEDVLALQDALQASLPNLRVALIGFSFGAFVMARVARTLVDRGSPAWRACLAGTPFDEVEGQRRYDTPTGISDLLVVHGEKDECVSLAAVLEWARPNAQPVVVVPGADHFFSGKLHILRNLLLSHLAV